MLILRLLSLPLRLLYWFYARLRNWRRRQAVLVHTIPERFTQTPSAGWLARLGRNAPAFSDYLSLLDLMARSPDLKRVAITIPALECSWAEVQSIARRLAALQAAGKELLAFAEGGNLKSLVLLACAPRRFAAPFADFLALAPNVDGLFLKAGLTRLGVAVELYSSGKYKDQGYQMFTRTGFSPEARRNLLELVGDLREQIDAHLAAAPGATPQSLAALARLLRNNAQFDGAQLFETGFLEGVLPGALWEDLVLIGTSAPDRSLEHDFAGPGDLASGRARPANADADPAAERATARAALRKLKAELKLRQRRIDERALVRRERRRRFQPLRLASAPAIAIVSLEGPIINGKSDEPPRPGAIAALALRETFRQLETSAEEAAFLWINSPGGSAEASEILYQSIHELSRRKPVIAVISGVGASGGYYIACAANRIYCSDMSLVGSIGVIRLRPNLSGLYKKLGVRREPLLRDPTRDLFSEAGALSPAAKRLAHESSERIYHLFLDRVSRGRGLEPERLAAAAEGRVFSGRRFRSLAMVDGAADLLEAVRAYAAERGYQADQEFRAVFYPEFKPSLRSLINLSLPGAAAARLRNFLEDMVALAARESGTLAYSPLAAALANPVRTLEEL